MSEELWRKNLLDLRSELVERSAGNPQHYHLLVDTSLRRILKLTDPGHSQIANGFAYVVGTKPDVDTAHVWYDLPPYRSRNASNTWAVRSEDFDDSDTGSRVRQEFYCGEWNVALMRDFNAIEARATGICRGIPDEIITSLNLQGSTGRWLWTVHRLGWLRVKGSPLIAMRMQWFVGGQSEYFDNGMATYKEMRERFPDPNDPDEELMPDRYYSVLERGTYDTHTPSNIYSASVDAIDILLTAKAVVSPPPIAPSPAEPPSKDGPVPPRGYRLNGRLLEMTPLLCQLMQVVDSMRYEQPKSFADVRQAVEKWRASDVADSTISGRISQLNNWISEKAEKLPFRIRESGEHLLKEMIREES